MIEIKYEMNTISTRQVISVLLSVCSFVSSFYAVGKLIIFLSNPTQYYVYQTPSSSRTQAQDGVFTKTVFTLFTNSILISLFILQHSVISLKKLKNLFARVNMEESARSVYILGTSWCLVVLIKYWTFTPDHNLWSINANDGSLWWFFIITHAVLWMIIYAGVLLMDITELLGVKQVYYNLNNLGDPLQYKSHQLQTLYSHMRHPSFTALICIFWIYPVMSYDRLLIGTILTIYMRLAWRTDETDLDYQYNQLIRKRIE